MIESNKSDCAISAKKTENGEVAVLVLPAPGRQLPAKGIAWIGSPANAVKLAVELLAAVRADVTAEELARLTALLDKR